ncbi:MAG: hypothetical protein QXM75_03575 [Candidatus Diapherotrites archaeon]
MANSILLPAYFAVLQNVLADIVGLPAPTDLALVALIGVVIAVIIVVLIILLSKKRVKRRGRQNTVKRMLISNFATALALTEIIELAVAWLLRYRKG